MATIAKQNKPVVTGLNAMPQQLKPVNVRPEAVRPERTPVRSMTPPGSTMVEPKRPTGDMIRERAYQIYLANRDQSDRNPIVDWIQAERELLGKG